MKLIFRGCEQEPRLNLLMQLTRINSPQIKKALKLHLVDGLSQELAADLQGVPQNNVSRAVSSLDRAAAIVEQIKQLDWSHIKIGETANARQ